MLTMMLKPRPAKHNKRIRDSTLLESYPFLSQMDMLKAMVYPHGVKYAIYAQPPEDTYYIAFVELNGGSELIAKHQGRVEDLEWLLTFY
jgi:hypothetical protein